MPSAPVTNPPFTPALLGQTEKALNAILDRLLAGTGVSEPQWVTLTLAVTAGGAFDRDAFAGRVARGLRVGKALADERIDDLVAAGLLDHAAGDKLKPTEEALELHTRVRAEVGAVTERMWGDQQPEDLATAADVLSAILARADAELERDEEPGSAG